MSNYIVCVIAFLKPEAASVSRLQAGCSIWTLHIGLALPVQNVYPRLDRPVMAFI